MPDFVDHRFGDITVRIDRGLCIGSGNCMKVAPEVFEFDDGSVVALKENAPDIDRDRLVESCRVCPVDALTVLAKDGAQIVPPP